MYFGTPLLMFWAKRPNVIMAAIFVSDPRRKTVSTMRWLPNGDCSPKLPLMFLTALFSPVLPDDYPALEKVSDMIIKEKQKFERLVVRKETLLEMFSVRKHMNRRYDYRNC